MKRETAHETQAKVEAIARRFMEGPVEQVAKLPERGEGEKPRTFFEAVDDLGAAIKDLGRSIRAEFRRITRRQG